MTSIFFNRVKNIMSNYIYCMDAVLYKNRVKQDFPSSDY